jgi:threonine dehydrogenase-like Zn-dependent dehydrogenase
VKAVTWHGTRDVRVTDVPEPTIEQPTDAIVRITSTAICGSDLHLYEVLGPFIDEGFTLGHEPMGIVEAVGSEVGSLAVGDRVVVPFNIACGSCWMCTQGLQSQCETTQVRHEGPGYGAALFGYTRLYGNVPGGQAELLRVPMAGYGPIKVPEGPADDRFLFLSDVLPTAWQAVRYADPPQGGSVAVLGLGPIGDMATRIAQHLGYRVFGVDVVPERLARCRTHGVEVFDFDADDVIGSIREATEGRGPDAVIDAVGMEAHGSPGAKVAQKVTGVLPDPLQAKIMERVGVDRLAALQLAIELVRRGGTISISGVYGGMTDPLPMLRIFDKQIQIRMGQANVRRWVDDILPLLDDTDVLGVDDFATHHLPLSEAPSAYETFQKKQDGMIKAVLRPGS